jgi:hypothetical protein
VSFCDSLLWPEYSFCLLVVRCFFKKRCKSLLSSLSQPKIATLEDNVTRSRAGKMSCGALHSNRPHMTSATTTQYYQYRHQLLHNDRSADTRRTAPRWLPGIAALRSWELTDRKSIHRLPLRSAVICCQPFYFQWHSMPILHSNHTPSTVEDPPPASWRSSGRAWRAPCGEDAPNTTHDHGLNHHWRKHRWDANHNGANVT